MQCELPSLNLVVEWEVYLSLFGCVFAAPGAAATLHKEPSYAGVRDTYAVVEIGGHQLIVEEGRWYTVNRLEVGRLTS